MGRTVGHWRKPQITFALSMLLVALLPLVVGLVFYARSSAVAGAQQADLVDQSMRLTLQKLDADIAEMTNIAIKLKGELRAPSLPEGDKITVADRLRFREITGQLASAQREAGSFVEALYIMRAEGSYAVSHRSVAERAMIYRRFWAGVNEQELDRLHRRRESGTLIGVGGERAVFLITLSRSAATQAADCQLALVVSQGYFASVVEQFGLEGASYVLSDLSGTPILSAGQSPDGDDVALSHRSSAGNYLLTAQVPRAVVAGNAGMLRALYFWLFGATVVAVGLLVWQLSRRSAMPINEIIAYIRLHYRPDDEGDGLGLISSSIEQMIAEREGRVRQIQEYREREQLRGLADALLGLRQSGEGGRPYVAACFPLGDEADAQSIARSIQSAIGEGFLGRCVGLDGRFACCLKRRRARWTKMKPSGRSRPFSSTWTRRPAPGKPAR